MGFNSESPHSAMYKPTDGEIGIGYRAENKLTAKRIIKVKEFFKYYDRDDIEKGHYGQLNHDVGLLELSEPVDITPIDLPSDSNMLPNLKSDMV